MSRAPRDVVDDVERALATDEPVTVELAAELLAAMPDSERARWLRLAAEMAWRPAEPAIAEHRLTTTVGPLVDPPGVRLQALVDEALRHRPGGDPA